MTRRLSSPPFPRPGSRIVVVGTTGSGKTTLGGFLADLIGGAHVELDSLYWQENWARPKLEDFRAQVDQALSGPMWVVDGNYSQVRDLTWGRADTLVWLDYDLPTVLWRLTVRTFSRMLRHETLWNNNKETWKEAFFSKDSLFLYCLTSQRKQRRSYPQILSGGEYSRLKVIHLLNPRETRQWCARLIKEYAPPEEKPAET